MRTEETLRALLKAKGVQLDPERFEQALADLKGVAQALRMGDNDDFTAILAALETWNLIGDERNRALQAGQVKHLLQMGQAVQDHVSAFGEQTGKALQGIRDDVERIGITAKSVAQRQANELENAGAKAHSVFEQKAAATLSQMKSALMKSLLESRQDMGWLVAETAEAAAQAQSRKEAGKMALSVCAAVVCILLAMGASLFLGKMGERSRWEKDLAQSEAFYETSEGRKLREAWESGELKDILMCRKKGWQRDGKDCIPGSYEQDGKRYMEGWRIIF